MRLAVCDPDGRPRAQLSAPYPGPFHHPESWRQGFLHLVAQLPQALRQRVGAIAFAGTSGTLLLCQADGGLLPGEAGQALPYSLACESHLQEARRLVGTFDHPAAQASGSVARALSLLEGCRSLPLSSHILLRHQADWLMGWLLGNWRWGEEGNNIRLGWDVRQQRWVGGVGQASWAAALPEIVASGTVLGPMDPQLVAALGFHTGCLVVAGTTDANAAVLAADPAPDEGITVLGSTLVLKQFVPLPIQGVGVSCHRVNGRWLLGGASNTGAAILSRYFSGPMLQELSRQIDPTESTGLHLRPLLGIGERFPLDDPRLEPILTPRPVSDARFLQALLEGITAIEVEGWRRFQALGAPPVRRILTMGGGASNAQWRLMRQRALGLPIRNRPKLSAACGMARLAQAKMGSFTSSPDA